MQCRFRERTDLKPVHYLGAQIDFRRADLMSRPGFFASTSFKAGFPGDSGIMEDRDWTSENKDLLTHFSSHTNRTQSALWLDASIGASIPVKSLLYIKPFISGSWMHFAFAVRDGSGIYARPTDCTCEGVHYRQQCNSREETYFPINENYYEYSFKGREVIRYQQDWLLLASGFSVGTNYFRPFSFEFTFQISPFTYCAAVDEHIGSRTFRDYSAWGLFIEPKGRISFSIKRFDLSIEGGYRFIGRTKGPAYIESANSGSFSRIGDAGAGLSLMDLRFLARYQF